jgi:hypothetical protein
MAVSIRMSRRRRASSHRCAEDGADRTHPFADLVPEVHSSPCATERAERRDIDNTPRGLRIRDDRHCT